MSPTVEYRIEPAEADSFLAATQALGDARTRNGGYDWRIHEHTCECGRYLETFLSASWLDHLRRRERTTLADKLLQEKAFAFHRDRNPPRVCHLLQRARRD